MNGPESVKEACRTILNLWEEWEADAGQIAQQEQRSEAYDEHMENSLEVIVGGLVDDLTDEVAGVLQVMDGLAHQWGDEGQFRRCRDRLRSLLAEWQRNKVEKKSCRNL